MWCRPLLLNLVIVADGPGGPSLHYLDSSFLGSVVSVVALLSFV